MRAKARVKGDWLVRLPPTLSAREAMAIGTAGYTAMLAVMALERHGITPDRGPVVVTGAAGGVGSVAVALLAKLGYQVIASTGRPQEAGYLKELGAAEVIDREELTGPVKPLAKERWAGGIDSVGSTHPRQCALHDPLWRGGGGLRARRRHGSADLRRPVHPARRFAPRDRFRSMSVNPADPGLDPLGIRPGSRQNSQNDRRNWPRPK